MASLPRLVVGSGHVGHWVMFVQHLAGSPRLLHLGTVGQKQQEKTKPHEQALFQESPCLCFISQNESYGQGRI